MDEFVEKIKKSAAKVFDEAEKFTNAAVAKTGGIVNKTKLNYAIGASEGKIRDILAEVGRSVYDEFKDGGEFPPEIDERLKAVDILYDEIAELRAKIADMQNSIICPACSAYNDVENIYCSKCGVKMR